MTETQTNYPRFDALLDDRESAVLFAFTMLLAGVSAGWAGRALLAGEALTEQFWLVPVAVGLATSLYAQSEGL